MSVERVPIRTVVVANNREYFSPIDPFVSAIEKPEFIESDYDEADMDVMWFGDNKIVLLPKDLDPEFTADISRLFGFKNVRFIVPHETGAGLSQDVAKDKDSFQTVVDEISKALEPQVISWGYTIQFQNLLNSLSESGVSFRTPEIPRPEGLWIPDYLDTKAGSRKFLLEVKQKHPELEVQVPDGFVCDNLEEALQKIDYFLSKNKGVVFKANLGGSGIGVHIFRHKELSDPDKRKQIETRLRENQLFQNNKVVVEERIQADFNHHGVDPSVDAIVKEDGSVELQAVDAMVIHHIGQDVGFYGCIAGKGLFKEEQERQLKTFALAVGEELSKLGYRGWYDTDYVFTAQEGFYTTEINLRRTSMCYAIDLARLLIGEDWESQVALRTNDKFIRPNLHGLSYAGLKDALSGLMYPLDGEKRGIIITQSIRSKFGRGKFGYLVFGNTHDDTKAIEGELESRMDNINVTSGSTSS